MDVLDCIVKESGLDKQISRQFIKNSNDEYRNKVLNADRQAKYEMGVEGVPFFIFNNKYAVSGAQEVSVFLNILKKLIK